MCTRPFPSVKEPVSRRGIRLSISRCGISGVETGQVPFGSSWKVVEEPFEVKKLGVWVIDNFITKQNIYYMFTSLLKIHRIFLFS